MENFPTVNVASVPSYASSLLFLAARGKTDGRVKSIDEYYRKAFFLRHRHRRRRRRRLYAHKQTISPPPRPFVALSRRS